MQATAAVETASRSGYRSSEGNSRKDEPSNPKEDNALSSNGCNEAKLDADWDSLALEKRANEKKISNIDKIDLLEPSLIVSSDTNRERPHAQSDESADSTRYISLHETFLQYSDSEQKNEHHIHLNSDLDSEMQKREELGFDILEHQGNKMIDLERILEISDDCEETTEDVQKHAIDEDSQQECHTVGEQDYLSNCLSFEKTKELNIFNLEIVGLSSGHEVKYASNLEVNCVNLESSSSISLDSIDVCGQEDSPHVSKFQNSVLLREYHEPKHEKCKELEETSVMYHTASDEIVLSGLPGNQEYQSETGFLNPYKALKTEIYTSKMKSQVTETEDFCGNAVVENKLLYLEDPSTFPQDKASETLLQPCNDCPTFWASVFDDSVISSCDSSHYESLQNTPDSAFGFSVALPRTGVEDRAMNQDNSLKVASANATDKKCFHNMEGTCPDPGAGAAGCAVMVNQMVDVSTDFRACFTTSRATSARAPLASTASNTELTMMSKTWPGKWRSQRQRSVACDTGLSRRQDNEVTQMAVTEGSLGKSLSVDSFKPNGNFPNKCSLEPKTFAIAGLKEYPEREPHLSKAVERNLPPECCQNVTQRASRAELHLLNVQYQMCRRHCSDIYKLVVENREGLNKNFSSNSTQKELGPALLSVLEDLKVRYMYLKEKIKKGIALEELPPLSIESRLLSAFSTFASRMSSPSDTSHPEQGLSPQETGFKDGGIEIHFSQLKLDDKDCRNQPEISEDWFDAEENLIGVDFSGLHKNHSEQGAGDPEVILEKESVEPFERDKCFLIHVGGLCPSVSQADLRSHFQKYQVSEISIYDSSTNYRYASLVFKRNSDAKMAVKEMNGIEINGKSVNVRLIKTPGEHTSPLSSKNGNRASLNNLEKTTSKGIHSASSISRLPRTRPRQPGSEQDSEGFHFHQQHVKKNCKQIESKLLPDAPVQFIPANTLNLRSFTKIIKRLAELHPEVSRDHIIDALQEVRINHKGFLNGLTINTIVEMTSSVLKNSPSS